MAGKLLGRLLGGQVQESSEGKKELALQTESKGNTELGEQ